MTPSTKIHSHSNVSEAYHDVDTVRRTAPAVEVLGHHSAIKEVEEFIGLANLFEIDKSIRTATIQLRKQYKIKLPDAIIAATALAHGLTLVTQNEKDFVNIDGLQVTNPFNI